MDWKGRKKILRRDVARYGMKSAYWLLNRLPYAMVRGVLRCLIAIGFLVTGRHRRVARESLKIAFGHEKTEQEIEAIIDKCFQNIGQSMIEMIYFNEHLEMMNSHISYEGKENLEAALAKGAWAIPGACHPGADLTASL